MMKNWSFSFIHFGDVNQTNTIQSSTNQLINNQINEYKDNTKFDSINLLKKLQKIEQDNFSNIDNKTKYKLLVNIAAAYERQNKKPETAEYLIKAKEYSNDCDAFYYAIYGYLVQNNRKDAEKLFNELKTENPQNNYVFMSKILLNSFNNIYPLEKNVPESKINEQNIIRLLAMCYHEAKKDKEALIWLEKYYQLNSEDLEIQGVYAYSLLNHITSKDRIYFGNQWQKDDKDKLNLSIELFSNLWEQYYSKQIKKKHLSDGLNLCKSLQLAGNQSETKQIAEELLKIDKTNFKVCYCYADIFAKQGKFNKAIQVLEPIFGSNSKTDFLLIELLLYNKQYSSVLSKIEKLDKTSFDNLHKEHLSIFQAIAIYHEQGKDIAYKFIDKCNFTIFDCRLNIFNFYHNIVKDSNRAATQLQLIEDNLTNDTAYHNKLHLADIYYDTGKYQKAINLYQQLSLSKPSNALNQLSDSLFKVDDRIGIKNILDNFDKNNKDSDFYISTSTNFYFLTGQLGKAELQINKAIKKHPNNLHHRLLWASALLRQQKYNEVKDYIKTKPKFPDASPDDQMELVKLFRDNEQLEIAVKLGYETLRNNWNNANCHMAYSMGVIILAPEDASILDVSKVSIDSTLTITNDFNETKIYSIVKNADTSFGEIGINHYIAKKAIGKKAGDTFITENVQKKIWTITEITSKYVGLYRKSTTDFNQLFPDSKDMFFVNIRKGKEFEDISQFIDNKSDSVKNTYEVYQNYNIPVSSLAGALKENIIKLWQSLLLNQTVKVNTNTPDNKIKKPIENDNGYIVDGITLYLMFQLNIHNDIKQYLKDIVIVQATLDLFLRLVEENILSPSMSISKENGKYYRQDITKQDTQNYNNSIQELYNWTKDNCQIMPTTGNLANKHNDFDKRFDLSTAETLIAAESSNRTLLTDDKNLRTICKHLTIDSICSKNALYWNKQTNNQKYYSYLYQLRLMNCVYIPLEIGELWHWFEQCKVVNNELMISDEIQIIKKYRDDFLNITNSDRGYFEYLQYSNNVIIDVIFYILIADETPYTQEKINWIMDNLYINYGNVNFFPNANPEKMKVLEVCSFLISNAVLGFTGSKTNIKKYMNWTEQRFLQEPSNSFIKQIADKLFNKFNNFLNLKKIKKPYFELFIDSMPVVIKMELNKIYKNKQTTKNGARNGV